MKHGKSPLHNTQERKKMKIETALTTFSQDRLKAWNDLLEPKPEWELFKRLLRDCDWNPLLAHERWLKPMRLQFKQTLDTEAPLELLDRFIIFTECAPADMLCDWETWVNR